MEEVKNKRTVNIEAAEAEISKLFVSNSGEPL